VPGLKSVAPAAATVALRKLRRDLMSLLTNRSWDD
jgi:hypothetical protein